MNIKLLCSLYVFSMRTSKQEKYRYNCFEFYERPNFHVENFVQILYYVLNVTTN